LGAVDVPTGLPISVLAKLQLFWNPVITVKAEPSIFSLEPLFKVDVVVTPVSKPISELST